MIALLAAFVCGAALDLLTTSIQKELEHQRTAGERGILAGQLSLAVNRSSHYDAVWIITGQKRYRIDRGRERARVLGLITQLERLEGDPEDRRMLLSAVGATQSFFSELDRLGDGEGRIPVPSRLMRLSDLNDRVHAVIQPYIAAKMRDFSKASREGRRYERLADWIARITVVTTVALAILLLWILRVALLEPMRHLMRTIIAFRNGDKEARARLPHRKFREAQAAASGFNDLADWLNDLERRRMDYLAAVAHDFKNPLSAMKTAISLLRTDNLRARHEKMLEVLDLVSAQIERLRQMLNDWTDVQSIEKGTLTQHFSEADLREVVSGAARLWREASRNHAIECSMPNYPVVSYFDPTRISQVLNNILSNAVKFSPSGGTVRIRLARERDQAVITVTDQGIGIPEQDLKGIFEPYRRSSISHSIPGVGLGLWNSRKLIEAHGGRVTTESQVGAGTTFRITIPARSAELRSA